MRRSFVYLFVVLFVFSGVSKVYSQWVTSGTNVYYNGGKVGIGTSTPTQALNVKGRVSIAPAGTEPADYYKGSLVITQPAASGQYINLIRDNMYPWSIGTVYNSNTFAIGQGQGGDASFTNPYFVIKDFSGNVGIGTTAPAAKLHIMNAKNTDAAILATSSESNKLVVRSGDTQPVQVSVFKILHEYGTNRNNGYISFNRGKSFDDGFLDFGTSGVSRLLINSAGNVGIGTTNPGTKLDVAGTIRAQEVKVCLNQGCDFVFAPDYDLMPLHELDSFISENKHLPEVAPAAVMEADGISLSEMNAKLLQKIEELTLYIIAQDKKIADQDRKYAEQDKRTTELENEVKRLKVK